MDYLDLDWLNDQKVAAVTKHTKWIRLERPLSVTIDGETGEGSIIKPLAPVQEKMVSANGTQCGFCTPGFICALFALAQSKENICENVIIIIL